MEVQEHGWRQPCSGGMLLKDSIHRERVGDRDHGLSQGVRVRGRGFSCDNYRNSFQRQNSLLSLIQTPPVYIFHLDRVTPSSLALL